MPPSSPVRVDVAFGVATVGLAFPGSPVNALTPARLSALDAAWGPLLHDPGIDVLVVRSRLPGGFCGGHDPDILDALAGDEEAAAFARAGQAALDRLAAADCVTLAFVEGPCVGPGAELALACDWRIAVAGADFGFDPAAPPCWGGSARPGGIDDTFSRRRANVELQLWIDRLQTRPRKRSRPADPAALAAERAGFRTWVEEPTPHPPSLKGRGSKAEVRVGTTPLPRALFSPFPSGRGVGGGRFFAAA